MRLFDWFFTKKSPSSPIGPLEEAWIHEKIGVLLNAFEKEHLLSNILLLPNPHLHPILKNQVTEQSAKDAFDYVCRQMNVQPNTLCLKPEWNSKQQISSGGLWGSELCIQTGAVTAGSYTYTNGNHLICLSLDIAGNMTSLLGTIAHEVAHYKLLGEGKLHEDSEYLTDLLTVCYGFGCFLANQASNYLYTYDESSAKLIPKASGYMTQEMFGYALAVHSFLIDADPKEVAPFLRVNVRDVYQKGVLYLKESGRLMPMKKYFQS